MKIMRLASSVTMLGLVALLVFSARADYASENKKVLESILGKMPDYTFRGAPVSNFGIGSLYKNVPGKPAESGWFGGDPESWFVSEDAKAKWYPKIIRTGDYGTVQLTKEKKKNRKFGVSLPAILRILGVGISSDYTRGVKTQADIQVISSRKMDWIQFSNAVQDKAIAPEIVDAINTGTFVLGAADILYGSYTITIDTSRNSKLNAALSAQEKVGKIVGADGKLELGIERGSAGHYTLTSGKQVIPAVLYLTPPKVAGLNPLKNPALRNLKLWRPVHMESQTQRLDILRPNRPESRR